MAVTALHHARFHVVDLDLAEAFALDFELEVAERTTIDQPVISRVRIALHRRLF